jgi:hypothetical protein
MEHLKVAAVCLTSVLEVLTALQQCVQAGMCHRRDDDDGLDHRGSRRCAWPHRSVTLGGGRTTRDGGLTASL